MPKAPSSSCRFCGTETANTDEAVQGNSSSFYNSEALISNVPKPNITALKDGDKIRGQVTVASGPASFSGGVRRNVNKPVFAHVLSTIWPQLGRACMRSCTSMLLVTGPMQLLMSKYSAPDICQQYADARFVEEDD